MSIDTSNPAIQKIIAEIQTVFDPEIPVNIWDMGMIYSITTEDQISYKIVMTVTAPNCPVADSLPQQVREAAERAAGPGNVWVELTFDPPWNPDLMTDEAKLELGLI